MDEDICPHCGGKVKYYDSVSRIVRTTGRRTSFVSIPRYRCTKCGEIHRKLPSNLLPFKQYEKEIIRGVQNGWITPETYGYEDYPCEMTMIRWKSQKMHSL